MATNAQLQAQVQELTRRLNAMAPVVSATSFLGALSKLPHQTTSNATGTDGFGGGVWTSSQQSHLLTLQDVVNGVVNAVNNLQTNLQSHNFES